MVKMLGLEFIVNLIALFISVIQLSMGITIELAIRHHIIPAMLQTKTE